MIKSQNTKNEQLTEQFNHGLLPDGWYYYKASDGRSDIATEYGLFCIEADNKVKVEVLEKVPTFEEWQASEKYNKHLEEVIKIYERKDKQATETSIAYNELAKENEELKLLVAEALSHFKASFPFLYRDWIEKADKFLGEDKCGKRK